MTHVQYAWTQTHPGTPWIERKNYKEGQRLADDLINLGCIRVVNSHTFEFNANRITVQAIDTMMRLLIDCAAKQTKQIENQMVWFTDVRGKNQELSVPSFIEAFGTRKHSDLLFEKLEKQQVYRRMAKRIAAHWTSRK
jgi:hypothetical protein